MATRATASCSGPARAGVDLRRRRGRAGVRDRAGGGRGAGALPRRAGGAERGRELRPGQHDPLRQGRPGGGAPHAAAPRQAGPHQGRRAHPRAGHLGQRGGGGHRRGRLAGVPRGAGRVRGFPARCASSARPATTAWPTSLPPGATSRRWSNNSPGHDQGRRHRAGHDGADAPCRVGQGQGGAAADGRRQRPRAARPAISRGAGATLPAAPRTSTSRRSAAPPTRSS